MENKKQGRKCTILFITAFSYWLFLLPAAAFSQQYSKYWVQFTDRNNTPYDTAHPAAYLSAKAIQRRQNQKIAIAQNDLPVNPAYIDSVQKISGVTLLNRSKWFNAITIYVQDTNALKKIKSFSFVLKTKPVQRYSRKETDIEKNTDPFGISHLKLETLHTQVPVATARPQNSISSFYNYGPSFRQIDMLGGVCLHDQGFHGEGMVIAVLDAGFYKVDSLPAFDSLRRDHRILGTRDFVDQDTMVYDSHTHGTMTLSTMAANLPGKIIGTAPKASYWLLRTEQGATEYVIEEDNWVSGAEFADSVGADILSTSLGYTEFDPVKIDSVTTIPNPANHTYKDMNGNTCHISIGTDIAVSKGMFAVCSAGNSGTSPWHYIGAPADADSVLAVGAVDSLGHYATFSSTGPSYDGRVKPNVAAQGQAAVVTDPATTGIAYVNGTSFSCPLTAGLVACLWQANPTSANMDLFRAIELTASQHIHPDSLIGNGISDFCAAKNVLSVHENPASGVVINAYPNPFSGSVSVSLDGLPAHTYGLNMKLYDVLGKEVKSFDLKQGGHKMELDCKDLPNGVYVLGLIYFNQVAKSSGKSYSSVRLIKY